MHSFTSTLIAVALATFASAAPVDLPGNLPVSLPIDPASLPLPVGAIPPVAPVSSVEDKLGSLAGTLPVRDVLSDITDAVNDVHTRDTQLSVAVVFDDLSADIKPFIDQLNALVPSECTLDKVTDIVGSIKGPVLAAVAELQALVGAEASVVLASASGAAELSVAEIATLVGGEVNLVLSAVGNVLAVVQSKAKLNLSVSLSVSLDANANTDIVAEVGSVLTDLGCAVTSLVGAVVPLVDGLAASLAAVVAPVDYVVSALELTDLAGLLGTSVF